MQFTKRYFTFLGTSYIFCLLILQGCASSDISRQASSQINTGYEHTSERIDTIGKGSIADSYDNSTQTTKGVLIGGTAGAVAGSFTSGVGFLPGAAGGAIFGGAIGAYIDAHTTLADKLKNRGVNVIVLGDQILIVVPSTKLFNGRSADMNPYSYSTLDLIAQFIGKNPNITVKISAYTNPNDTDRGDTVLSQQQANAVERYLWRTGINTRMLYAVGYGPLNPVTCSPEEWTAGDNYRVEITLEKLPV